MPQQLISRSPDLQRLRDDGYDIAVRGALLLVKGVPYVNSRKEVAYGTLVSTLATTLTSAGEVTTTPDTHVVRFCGDHPCHRDGSALVQIAHSSSRDSLGEDVVVDHSFSSKPQGGYRDYYEKMATYVAIISSPAQALDPNVTARTYPVVEVDETESVFKYLDSATTRAGIGAIAEKLELEKVAIVGLGGTGAYVLDLVAKTRVRSIHLFDGDTFHPHNAFRSPGAPSAEELISKPKKVSHYQAVYSRMRRNIEAHGYYIDGSNVERLQEMDFVFICIDGGPAKEMIVESLETAGKPFIDVGMGVYLINNALGGVLRITTSTPTQRAHVRERQRIPFTNGVVDDAYSSNIQIADLNCLNATLAVVKWKKLFGFYQDLEREHFTTYTIDGNSVLNEDLA